MADLNWGKAAAGFVGGALTGYQQVLTTKMKEDSENRMEEARMVRAKSMAQWTDTNITDPNRIADQTFTSTEAEKGRTFQKDMQLEGFKHSESLADKQMAHAESMRRLSESAADKRYQRENSPEALKAKALALYEAQGAVKGKEADSLYANTLKGTGDQAAALMAKNDFIASGMSNIEEYNKYKASAGAKKLENITEMARKPIQEQMTAIQSELSTSPETVVERLGKEYGITAKSPQEAANKLMQLKSAEIYTTSASVLYGQEKKSAEATGKATENLGPVDLSKGFLPADKLNKVSEMYLNKDPNYTELVNKIQKENPEQYKRIINRANTLRKESGSREAQNEARLNMFNYGN